MAQCSRSPIGVNLFWETGANPPVEWQPWLATFKMAVMAQHNIEVEKLLRLKPARTELFYPTMPTLEEELSRHKRMKPEKNPDKENSETRKDVWTGKMNAKL